MLKSKMATVAVALFGAGALALAGVGVAGAANFDGAVHTQGHFDATLVLNECGADGALDPTSYSVVVRNDDTGEVLPYGDYLKFVEGEELIVGFAVDFNEDSGCTADDGATFKVDFELPEAVTATPGSPINLIEDNGYHVDPGWEFATPGDYDIPVTVTNVANGEVLGTTTLHLAS